MFYDLAREDSMELSHFTGYASIDYEQRPDYDTSSQFPRFPLFVNW